MSSFIAQREAPLYVASLAVAFRVFSAFEGLLQEHNELRLLSNPFQLCTQVHQPLLRLYIDPIVSMLFLSCAAFSSLTGSVQSSEWCACSRAFFQGSQHLARAPRGMCLDPALESWSGRPDASAAAPPSARKASPDSRAPKNASESSKLDTNLVSSRSLHPLRSPKS